MQSKGFGRIKKRREQLEARKDSLSEINQLIDWGIFRRCLEQLPQSERKSKASRKPIDRLLLLKLLILQQLYNLSDEELDYQTHDRLSFRLGGDKALQNSQPFCDILDRENDADEIWADSAYRSEALEVGLEAIGYVSQIHERGYRNHPLTEAHKGTNRGKSKVRAKVEHVFGAWVMNLGSKQVRCIGIQRVRAQIGLKYLAYNVRRYVFWRKKELQTLQSQYA